MRLNGKKLTPRACVEKAAMQCTCTVRAPNRRALTFLPERKANLFNDTVYRSCFYWNHYPQSERRRFKTDHGEFEYARSWDAQRYPPHGPHKRAYSNFYFRWIFPQFPHHGQNA
jgi:hypothetical protein